jgi:hypothetical protein
MYRVGGMGESGIDGIGEENERGASSWRSTVEKNEVKFLDSNQRWSHTTSHFGDRKDLKIRSSSQNLPRSQLIASLIIMF